MNTENEYPYRLELDVIGPVCRTVTKYFKTLKDLRGWQRQADIDNNIYISVYREYKLNPETGCWERFTVFGTTIVLFSLLEREYHRLQQEQSGEEDSSL